MRSRFFIKDILAPLRRLLMKMAERDVVMLLSLVVGIACGLAAVTLKSLICLLYTSPLSQLGNNFSITGITVSQRLSHFRNLRYPFCHNIPRTAKSCIDILYFIIDILLGNNLNISHFTIENSLCQRLQPFLLRNGSLCPPFGTIWQVQIL